MNDFISENLKPVLKKIKKKGKLSGAVLSYMDGTLLCESVTKSIDIKGFTAMCASVLKSSIGIGKMMGGRKVVKIIAELEEQNIIIVECDEKIFLTLVIEEDSKIEPILRNLSTYIGEILENYSN